MTTDFTGSAKASSQRATKKKKKNRGSNQCGPMIPSELWRNDKQSQLHVSHTMSNTNTHTHRVCSHTLFACPCRLKIKNLIILVKSPGAWADSLWRAIMCIWTHTHTWRSTCTHYWPSPCCTLAHMRTITHTSALQPARSHFSLAQDVMKSALLLKLGEGRWESSLSPTHAHFTWHLRTRSRAESWSSAQSLSPPARARSLPAIGLSPEAKRPGRRRFNFYSLVALSLWGWRRTRGREEEKEEEE